ncbi:MAG: hypothetical protein LBV23_09095 [Deltaproteobacteria bacterium]|jgi:hypothetical protein|nr:hypothetical protein [Deltaproteobacteria bacterium]
MKYKALMVLLACAFFALPASLRADPLLDVKKAQKRFIREYGFTPGWYVQCRSRDAHGCQVAKSEVLSDPSENSETTLMLLSDGTAGLYVFGKSLPDEAQSNFRREGANIRLDIKIPGKKTTTYLFKPSLDRLESLNDGHLFFLVIDEVNLQSAG